MRQPPQWLGLFVSGGSHNCGKDRYRDGLGLLDSVLERALTGRFGPHQRFLVAQQLAHIDVLDEAIKQVSAKIAQRLRPCEAVVERLDTIPGLGR